MSDETVLRDFVPGWVAFRREFRLPHWAGKASREGYIVWSPLWLNAPYLFNPHGSERWFVHYGVAMRSPGRRHRLVAHALSRIPEPTRVGPRDLRQLIALGLHGYTLHKIKEAAGVS